MRGDETPRFMEPAQPAWLSVAERSRRAARRPDMVARIIIARAT